MKKNTQTNNTEEPVKSEEVVDEKETMVKITATKNSFLADGTFVAKDETVEVTKEYADRIEREHNKSFLIK